jgi:hypothetical protein
MSTDALDGLAAQLRAAPPESLAQLDDAHLRDLAEAIAGARRRQAAELEAAGEKAFNHIPWLLRGPIKKLFG